MRSSKPFSCQSFHKLGNQIHDSLVSSHPPDGSDMADSEGTQYSNNLKNIPFQDNICTSWTTVKSSKREVGQNKLDKNVLLPLFRWPLDPGPNLFRYCSNTSLIQSKSEDLQHFTTWYRDQVHLQIISLPITALIFINYKRWAATIQEDQKM